MPDTQHSSMTDRMPPQSVQAERCVLGSLLRDGSMGVPAVAPILEPSHFVREIHQTIYRAILDLDAAGSGIDLVTLREHLGSRGLLDAIGGIGALVDIQEEVPAPDHVEYYARIVAGKAARRALIQAASEATRLAYDESTETAESLSMASAAIDRAIHAGLPTTGLRTAAEVANSALDSLLNPRTDGIPTGLPPLDRALGGGFYPGEFIAIGGLTGMGKTTMGVCMAESMAASGMPVAYFSVEMGGKELARKLICARAGVNEFDLRLRPADQSQAEALTLAAGRFGGLPLFLDETPGMTASLVRAMTRRLVVRYGIRACFVDYIQELAPEPGAGKQNREQNVKEMARVLKSTARELGIAVVGLAQLNTGPERRPGHRPQAVDFRESQGIPQAADTCILLHRPGHWLPLEGGQPEGRPPGHPCPMCGTPMVVKTMPSGANKLCCPAWRKSGSGCRQGLLDVDERGDPEDATKAEIIIDKQRHGPKAIVKVRWDPQRVTFTDDNPPVEDVPDF